VILRWMPWIRPSTPIVTRRTLFITATVASQYPSIRYTDRLAKAGIEPSVGSVGDSYDNALAESIIGLYKTEVIRHSGPWRCMEHVESVTIKRVDWFNHRRQLEPIGDIPPAESEEPCYENLEALMLVAGLKQRCLRKPRAGQPEGSALLWADTPKRERR